LPALLRAARWHGIDGLPLHRHRLEDTAAAHAVIESEAVGKVLITVALT
jgi:hypothetical protein